MRRVLTLVLLPLATLAMTTAIAKAQEPAPPAQPETGNVAETLDQARALRGDGRYEDVIDLLEPLLEDLRPDPERLQETYLLLIESHVLIANEFEPEASARRGMINLARQLVHECLGVPELRHTQANELGSVPIEMTELFEEVRREIFGTLWITSLDPADAEVLLDSVVMTPDESGDLRETDLPAGTHLLVLRHPDRKEIVDEIEIVPAQVLSKEYVLPKKKGAWWYVTRIAVPVAAVAAVVVALVGSDEPTDQPEEPLPGPPDPPAKGF
jgi:hypothetical protein